MTQTKGRYLVCMIVAIRGSAGACQPVATPALGRAECCREKDPVYAPSESGASLERSAYDEVQAAGLRNVIGGDVGFAILLPNELVRDCTPSSRSMS